MKKFFAAAVFLFSFFPAISFSQSEIEGIILSEEDNSPVSYASIGVKNKAAGCVSDATGKFSLKLPISIKETDSVIISSVGFERTGFTIASIPQTKQIHLKALGKILKPVVVKSHFRERNIGMKNEAFLFFRTWQGIGSGGEIGQIMRIPAGPVSIHRVRVKIDNKYDSCRVRLRIRNVVKNEPAEDLITENIIQQIGQTTSEDNIDFDIPENMLDLKERKVYVGFEILDAGSVDSLKHSVSFVGNEYGLHLYKSYSNSTWEWEQHFGLYIKMSLSESSD